MLDQRRPESIDSALRDELAAQIAPISPGYLRSLLLDSGFPLEPDVEGVRQDNYESLLRTLIALAKEYSAAKEAGETAKARACRHHVIEAKNHARLVMRRVGSSARLFAIKQEMVQWMVVWLENPGVFEPWARLRSQSSLPGVDARNASGAGIGLVAPPE